MSERRIRLIGDHFESLGLGGVEATVRDELGDGVLAVTDAGENVVAGFGSFEEVEVAPEPSSPEKEEDDDDSE